MHIIDYLKKYKLKVVELAAKLKATTFSIYRWMEGGIPRNSKIAKIKELTNGEISESDWGVHNVRPLKAHKRKASSEHSGSKPDMDLEGNEAGKAKVRNGNGARAKKASKGLRVHKSDN